MKKEIRKTAFIKSLPIMCSYLFVGMAYGMMMQEAGFGWYLCLAASMTVYTGAFQFVLITLLSSGASFLTIAITAFLMNSRQLFYGLTFLEEFRKMGRRKPYMICTLTDETYAVNLTLKDDDEKKKQDIMFYVAMFSKGYWIVGSVLGAVIAHSPPLILRGSISA